MGDDMRSIVWVLVLLTMLGSVSALSLMQEPERLNLQVGENVSVKLILRADAQDREGVFFANVFDKNGQQIDGLTINSVQSYELQLNLSENKLQILTPVVAAQKSGSYEVLWGFKSTKTNGLAIIDVLQRGLPVTVPGERNDTNVTNTTGTTVTVTTTSSSSHGGGRGGGGYVPPKAVVPVVPAKTSDVSDTPVQMPSEVVAQAPSGESALSEMTVPRGQQKSEAAALPAPLKGVVVGVKNGGVLMLLSAVAVLGLIAIFVQVYVMRRMEGSE
jgi:hypothetical protein